MTIRASTKLPTFSNRMLNFELLKEMEEQIRKLNKEQYKNDALVKRFTDNGNNTTLYLHNSNYTDQDMEIVADQLKTNKVREHCSFLPLRLFQ